MDSEDEDIRALEAEIARRKAKAKKRKELRMELERLKREEEEEKELRAEVQRLSKKKYVSPSHVINTRPQRVSVMDDISAPTPTSTMINDSELDVLIKTVTDEMELPMMQITDTQTPQETPREELREVDAEDSIAFLQRYGVLDGIQFSLMSLVELGCVLPEGRPERYTTFEYAARAIDRFGDTRRKSQYQAKQARKPHRSLPKPTMKPPRQGGWMR